MGSRCSEKGNEELILKGGFLILGYKKMKQILSLKNEVLQKDRIIIC